MFQIPIVFLYFTFENAAKLTSEYLGYFVKIQRRQKCNHIVFELIVLMLNELEFICDYTGKSNNIFERTKTKSKRNIVSTVSQRVANKNTTNKRMYLYIYERDVSKHTYGLVFAPIIDALERFFFVYISPWKAFGGSESEKWFGKN